MQYVKHSLQEIAQVMASCDELGLSYTVQNAMQEKKKIGFFTRVEKVSYEPCYVLTVNEEENTNEDREPSDREEDDSPTKD